MTMDLRRSTHPDLLDELESPQPAPDSSAANGSSSRSSRSRRKATESAAPSAGVSEAPVADEGGSDDGDTPPPPEPAPPDVPEWLGQLRAATDPDEIIGLVTKNVDRDLLMKNEILSAVLGNMSNKRAQDLLRQQDQQRQDRDRQAAYERGDLYALGQLSAAELQQQRAALEAQTQAALNPYLQDVTEFQRALPEDVQKRVQGKQYDSFGAYLQAVHEARLQYDVEQEVKKREPALRKAELSSTVGTEMTPELDGGPAQQYREITDAQVASMTLEEYDRYFDDKGRPKPGVRVRLERGIDVRREQRR